MDLFPIVFITPIICPQKHFIDSTGRLNAYLDMNPSFYIDSSGSFILLIRRVNYRKFSDFQFSLYEYVSNSSYYTFQGTIKNDKPFTLELTTHNEIQVEHTFSRYPTYWTGLEDIRFLSKHECLASVPEYNKTGQPCIVRFHFDGSSMRALEICQPSSVEKNWMPFEWNGKAYVLYSLVPFVIKSVSIDDCKQIPISFEIEQKLKGYHGSTNAIPFEKGYLCLVHKLEENRIHHRWVYWSVEKGPLAISNPFVLFQHSYIEFPCSLVCYNERIFISLGVNDDKAFILEVSLYSIYKSLSLIQKQKVSFFSIILPVYFGLFSQYPRRNINN